MFNSGSFAPQLLQKRDSGRLGVPHCMQNRPAGARLGASDVTGAFGAENGEGWNRGLAACAVTG